MRRFQLFCVGLIVSLASFAQNFANHYFTIKDVDGGSKDVYFSTFEQVEFGQNGLIINGTQYDYKKGTKFLHLDFAEYGEEHDFDENGYCRYPDGGVMPAALVTEENYASLGLSVSDIGSYAIQRAGQMYWFAAQVNSGANTRGRYILLNDIDLKEHTSTAEGQTPYTYRWESIGTDSRCFEGEFDGRGHTIKNFLLEVKEKPDGTNTSYGLFGAVYGATIKNFSISGNIYAFSAAPDFSHTNYQFAYVGLIGQMPDGVVENVHSSINITSTNLYLKHIGGIVGSNADTNSDLLKNKGAGLGHLTINACSYSGTLDAGICQDGVGGIVGLGGNNNNLDVTNCLVDGTIKADYKNVFKRGGTNETPYFFGGVIGLVRRHITFYNNVFMGNIEVNGKTTHNIWFGAYMDGNVNSTFTFNNNYYLPLAKYVLASNVTDKADLETMKSNSYIITVNEEDPLSCWLCTGELVEKLGGNWTYVSKNGHTAYPKPYIKSHTHTYNENGFCTNCDLGYEVPVLVTDANKATFGLGSEYVGYYAIKNGGNLYWWASHANSADPSSKAVLVADDIDLEGSAHMWRCIGSVATPFSGIFDGNEKSIHNFYVRSGALNVGMFGCAYNATIKSFEIDGDIISSYIFTTYNPNAGLIARVGNGVDESTNPTSSLIQGIHSKLNIIAEGTTKEACVGGVAGFLDKTSHKVTVDKCWFSGTINVVKNTYSGGIIGLADKNHFVTNCLFDGSVTVNSGTKAGGIIGQVSSGWDGKTITNHFLGMQNCLSVGTLSGTTGYGMMSGIINNGTDAKYQKNNYYKEIESQPIADASVSSWHYAPIRVNDEQLETKVAYWLGAANWANVEGYDYPLPKLKSTYIMDACDHASHYNGICSNCGAHFQEPVIVTIDNYKELNVSSKFMGYYAICNGGNMYWISQKVQSGSTKIKAVLAGDIDMGGRNAVWEGIGRQSATLYEKARKFEGEFDGNGHTINNFYMQPQHTYSGLFNNVDGTIQKIRNFTLNGRIDIPTYKDCVGTVFGYLAGKSKTNSITSNVDIVFANGITGTNIGGIAGKISSALLDHCRYSGTIDCKSATNIIGGITGRQNGASTIQNCLFDGKITGTTTSVDLRCGGIVGYYESDNSGYITNCLVEGEISFPNTKATYNRLGIICGWYTKNGVLSITNTYYKGDNKTIKGGVITNIHGVQNVPANTTYTGKVVIDELTRDVTDDELADKTVLALLGTDDWTQTTPAMAWPIPFVHTHKYTNGFCSMDCDEPLEAPAYDVAENYYIENGGNLYWFAQHVNSNKTYTTANATLLNDIDLEGFDAKGNSKRKWTPIGKQSGNSDSSSDFAYKGIFDGRSYTISGLNLTAEPTIANQTTLVSGFFGFVETGTVKDFIINGKISTNFDGKTTIGVIGRMSGGLTLSTASHIQDITSSVGITVGANCKQNYIGGVVGLGWYDQNKERFTEINRCRFNGTITSNATTNTYVGGVVAITRQNELLLNCLYDGNITIKGDGKNTGKIGGIAGGTDSPDAVRGVQNCLSVGTISGGQYKAAILNSQDNTNTDNSFNNYYLASTGLAPDGWTTKLWKDAPIAVTEEALASGNIVYKLGVANWTQILVGEQKWAYPLPLLGSMSELPEIPGDTHEHFSNGFCTLCGSYFEEPGTNADGDYVIKNAGNIFWFAKELKKNGSNLTSRNIVVVPTNDDGEAMDYIDMGYVTDKSSKNYGTSTHNNNYVPIGTTTFPYTGLFDGKSKLIKNLYINTISDQTGFFGVVDGGTVKDVAVQGSIQLKTKAYNHIGLIGCMGKGTVTGVHSAMDIWAASGLICKHVGGVVGSTESSVMSPSIPEGTVTIDRCRYSGTMSLGSSVDCLAGIVGILKANASVSNCLYDGSITTKGKNCTLGGIFGYTVDSTVVADHNLSIGKLTAGSYTYTGAILGRVAIPKGTKKIYNVLNNYMNRDNARAFGGVSSSDCGIEVYALGNSSIASSAMVYQLGRDKWTMIDGCDHPVPAMTAYSLLPVCSSHLYNANGFCTVCGAYQPLDAAVGGVIQIKNGGQLYAFAEKFNSKDGTIAQNASVALANDIDLEGDAHAWYGIGKNFNPYYEKTVVTYPFTGTFDGKGHTINNLFISSDGKYNALFLYAKEAKIRNFNINGEMYLSTNVEHNAPVVARFEGSSAVVEDITSEVNINVHSLSAATPNYIGGVVGYSASGTINRCRYKGTINARYAYNGVGGICGFMSNTTILNCLFDGVMSGVTTNANLMVGGIAAYKGGDNDAYIKNCFVNGTINFVKSACSGNRMGIVFGYADFKDKTLAISDTYYKAGLVKNMNGDVVSSFGSKNAAKNGIITAYAYVATDEAISNGRLLRNLGIGHWWQKHTDAVAIDPYPIPHADGACAGYSGTYCVFCGQSKDGVIHIATPGELAGFRNTVNSSTGTHNAALENDIDMSTYNGGLFGDPIGLQKYQFTGVFDGKGHTISNLNVALTTDNLYVGFFGYVGKADIKDMTVQGQISTTKNSNNMRVGLIGHADLSAGKKPLNVTNVHARLAISTPNANQTIAIGGIMGYVKGKNTSPAVFDKCSFEGSISTAGNGYHGGIIGQCSDGYQTISNCLAKADITTSYYGSDKMTYLGGIVGYNDNTNFKGISNCIWISGSLDVSKLKSGYYKVGTIIANDTQKKKTYYSNNYVCQKSGESIVAGQGGTIPVVTTLTDADLKSGKACALVDKPNATSAWGQVLGNDFTNTAAMAYPMPGNTSWVKVDASKNYTAKRYILKDCGPAAYAPSDANGDVITAETLTYDRSFSDSKWQTFFVPVKMSYDEWSEDYDIAKITNYHEQFVDKTDQVHKNVLEAQLVTAGTLLPNNPYLIRAKHDTDGMTLANGRVATSVANTLECASTRNEFTFNGLIASTNISGENYYVLSDWTDAADYGDDAVEHIAGSVSVPSMRWYMKRTAKDQYGNGSSAAAPSRIRIHLEGTDDYLNWEEVTDIESVTDEGVYPVLYITPDGVAHETPQAGKINIVKMSDGTVRKMKVKTLSPTLPL